MKFKFDGLDDFEKELAKLERNAKELEKGENVSFEILFNETFMAKNTQFSSFEELLNASNYKVESQEDFEAIPDEEFDQFIRKTTRFSSWEDMFEEAGAEYISKKIGF